MWSFVKKQRDLLTEESGTIIKEWGGRLSVALVYPNTYHVGMSNLAIHTLYRLFNDRPQIVCERAFLPDQKALSEHRRTKTPVLSIETQRPLHEFDVIAFSVSFQNDFLNIIPILSLCSIPHLSSGRTDDHPLIIAGGCAVTMNPHPLDEIVDAFVIGEAEEVLGEIIPVLSLRTSHEQTVETLSKIAGVYVPPCGRGEGVRHRLSDALPHFPSRRVIKNLDDWPTQTVIYTPNTEFGDMHLIEMSRGCPRNCNFCATPCLYTPYRMRSSDAILKMVADGLRHRKRLGLIGSDLLAHSALSEVVNTIHRQGATFSPSSIRADELNETIALALAQSGHKSISLGIEAASERLRSTLGKRFSNERILRTATALAEHGITTLRLYFMIGLPGETDDDIHAIAKLAREIRSTLQTAAPKNAYRSSVTLSVNPFVPKPFTPFERMPFAGERALKEKIKTLNKLIKTSGGVFVHAEPIISAMCDAVISRGDRHLITFLEKCRETNSPRKALTALSEEDKRHLEEGFGKEENVPWLKF